ncbi:MAG TPA: hypothetical protein VFK05_19185 [Polyangiaceae bacterium]|nr:hypothetical protein [Polyangiaceae bacterium]
MSADLAHGQTATGKIVALRCDDEGFLLVKIVSAEGLARLEVVDVSAAATLIEQPAAATAEKAKP